MENNENQTIKENNTWGIASFVLSILSFLVDGIGILFAIIALICGIKSSKNTFGKIGLIISLIYFCVFLFSILGGMVTYAKMIGIF